MRSGPFVTSQRGLQATTGTTDNTAWLRSNQGTFQPSNHDSLRVVIDAQHARAQENGLATATQFGWGVYDVDVELIPSTGALNPEDSRLAHAEVGLHYYTPTPLRMSALRNLIDLERMEDEADAFDSLGLTAPAANPLLSTPLTMDEDTALLQGMQEPSRGQRVIRIGWAEGYPQVYANSTLSVDLNSDDDVSDTAESQSYVLGDGDTAHFSIFTRMEASVNPHDANGVSQIARDWAYPLSHSMVQGATHLYASSQWAFNPKLENFLGENLPGGLHTTVARFRGVQAVGGLIGLTIPEMFTAGIGEASLANNDFDLIVTLRCRSWTDMA